MITLQLTSLETDDILLTVTCGDSITNDNSIDFSLSKTLKNIKLNLSIYFLSWFCDI